MEVTRLMVSVEDCLEAGDVSWGGDYGGLGAMGGNESGHVDHGDKVTW